MCLLWRPHLDTVLFLLNVVKVTEFENCRQLVVLGKNGAGSNGNAGTDWNGELKRAATAVGTGAGFS